MRKVVVTGMGCVSALGPDLPTAWGRTNAGENGIRPVEVAAEGDGALIFSGLAAPAANDVAQGVAQRFGRRAAMTMDRFTTLGVLATSEALENARLVDDRATLASAVILYGAASGGNVTAEASYQALFESRSGSTHPLTIPRLMSSSAASHISMMFGVKGLCLAIASACASSANAVGEAFMMIRCGRADTVIAGGSDSSLNYGSLCAWRALRATSETGCRPFSADRDGTILGEGAATLVLEAEDTARRRGAPILAEIVGYGASSDAGHLTQPCAESGARAIEAAHRDSGVAIGAPLLISAHGTGTVLNDRSEAEALRRAYGDALDQCLVMATKPNHGHMLGASGAMELILMIMALNAGRVPRLLNHTARDPECEIPLALQTCERNFDSALSTSFAFGGLNCALLVRRAA